MSKNANEAQWFVAAAIDDTVMGLRHKAHALRVIGMAALADDLDWYAANIEPLPKLMFDAIGADLTRDLAASHKIAGGMLKLALAGAIRSPRVKL